MVQQDLQVSLTGKDVSASDAFRALARAANQAARSAGDSVEAMNKRVAESTDKAYADALSKMAKARRLATIESAKSLDDMGNRIAQSADEGTSRFGSHFASWAQTGLAGILGGVAASVTSSVMNVVGDAGQLILGQLKTSVIDYNSTLENATIGFTTMLGSGKKASDFLSKLQDFGLKTPFQTDQLIQLSQQMMGYGINAKQVIPTLTALGDAAAASGKTGGDGLNNIVLAFEQMSARGRVDLGDINQLTSGGVPALKILASQYHTTTGGILHMIHTGKLMSADALPKLITGIEKGTKSTAALGGMMQKQSGTFQGAMSNISDSLNRALGTAFQPVFKIVEKIAVGIQKFTSSKGFTKWANDTGKTVGKAMHDIGAALKAVIGDPKVQAAMGKLGQSLGKAFAAIGPAMAKILPDLIKFGKDVMPAIIDVITGVVDKLPTLLKWWGRLADGLAAAGPTIAGAIGFLSDFSGALFDLSAGIGNFVADAVSNFIHFVDDSKKRFGDLVGFISGVGGHIASGFIDGIVGAWGAVTSTVSGLINKIPLVVRQMLGIASPSKVFRQIGRHVGEGLNLGLLGSVDQIKSTSKTLAAAVVSAFKHGNMSKTSELYALDEISHIAKYLERLSNKRDALRQKLSGLKTDRSNVHDTTKAATVGYGDITGYAAPGDAVQGLAALVTKTKTFTTDLKALVKKGVKGALLSQLVDGWNSNPDVALTTAQGLLANPTDLKEIIKLQNQLSTAGAGLGAYAGHAEYDSQVAATAGRIKVDTWQMQRVAATTTRTIARASDIHVHVHGVYTGTKDDLAKSVAQVIRDAVKRGTIPKNWATG